MSISVELINNDEYYKIIVEPEEYPLYIVETTLGTGVMNDNYEIYDIIDEEWIKYNKSDSIISKTRVEKLTQLILPTDKTIEQDSNGKLCYFVITNYELGILTIGPTSSKIITESNLGKESYELLLKGRMIIIPDKNKTMIINRSFKILNFFVKGIESFEIVTRDKEYE